MGRKLHGSCKLFFFLPQLETVIYSKIAISHWATLIDTDSLDPSECAAGGDGLAAAAVTWDAGHFSAHGSPPRPPLCPAGTAQTPGGPSRNG